MRIPPFSTFRAERDTKFDLEGTIERQGKESRLVSVPHPAASRLRFLLNADGTFDGRAVNHNGTPMGWKYKPDPADVRIEERSVTSSQINLGGTNIELVYFGSTSDSINITYREFTGEDLARPAFTQNLIYAKTDPVIRFRDVVIRVEEAGNQSISYTVVSDGYPE